MLLASIPPNEAERIKNLNSYRILDTPFEPVFDEIVSLAAKICGTSYAAISLADRKRQWLKAIHGFKYFREGPRDISFCGHAILQDEIFYIPDACKDERFFDNPYVIGEPFVRVYAGMPLTSQEGYKLGTLCVFSHKPMPLNQSQLESLEQLSYVLMALLNARKKEARLALLGQVLDQLREEIMLIDPQTLECTYANISAHKAFKHPESISKLCLHDIAQASSSMERRQLVDALLSWEKNNIAVEVTRGHSDGEQDNVVELCMQRSISAAGNLLVVIGRDISERKKLDEVKETLHENLKRHHLELSNEMMLASEMHLRFLPSPGCINRVCFDWLFRASSYLGGDIFDYFPLDERYLCFHLIDVSGHSVSAALVAFHAQREMFAGRSEMLAVIHRMNGDIARAAPMTVESFNRKFAEMTKSSLYLTMIFGIVDTWTGEMALVQAGHPAPLYSKSDTNVMVPVGHGGFPIGILEHAEYEAFSLHMAPGSRLYLYSDGITDCPNVQDELFGQERMKHLLMQKHGAPLVEVCDAIENALSEWQGGKDGFDDDVTFLVLEYHAQSQNVQARTDSESNCASPCSG